MKTFSLHLQSTKQCEELDDIMSFVGEDASGSFGILADHARIMTCLKFGLARFKYKNANTDEEYLALPGGLLYFNQNILIITTRYYLRSNDYDEISNALEEKSRSEREDIANIKETLHRLDEKILKRLWEMQQGGAE
ncbi:MAG: F0F1 ATP synthase subunit epsilon [Gammaproteobacteria bacterium]|jgi:F-type H+-transporting ATPase subunit epsilon